MQPLYNTIGKTYDTTRKADPEIVQTLLRLLNPSPQGHYLDVACGSGNYTSALAATGLMIEGVDISEEMLAKARTKNPAIRWHQGDAQALPFQDSSFDGAICTLAIHHMGAFEAAFKEIYRVIKPGRFVLLTALPEQMKHYWLVHYFPKMLEDAQAYMPDFLRIERAFTEAGFKHVKQEPFFVSETLKDLFLYAGKYRPAMYLDPQIRAGISSFHVSANEEEVRTGLKALEADIYSGKIEQIIQQYEHDGGDYLFVVGEKL